MEDRLGRFGRIFLTGVLGLLPIAVTALVIGWLISFLYAYMGPESWFGSVLVSVGLGISATSMAPYVLGLLIVLAAIFLVGLVLEHRIGAWLGAMFDAVVTRIPVVSSVYDLSKRFTSIVDTRGGGDLKGMSPVWCFFGGEKGAAVFALLPSPLSVMICEEKYLGLLVPTAPVPFGGALIYLPATWIKPAEGGVEHLVNVYLSMGVTPPKSLTVVG
jgi:uncharacterized membrane protein